MSLEAPDACTLPTAERPARMAAFEKLFATAARGVESNGPTHARLRLPGPAGLEATVRDLTERETRCCSFFSFTVSPDGDSLTLDIQVREQYADVLASLIGRAAAASARS